MTTQDLGRPPAVDAPEPTEERDALDALFATSPAPVVRTSAAAVTGFALGLVSLLLAPLGSFVGLACLGAAVGLVVSIVGLARASRRAVSGGLLASLGIVLALATGALVGLRYVGIDTTISADVAATLLDWLRSPSSLVPAP